MAADSVKIDARSVFDNLESKQVEFTAEIDAEDHDFAVQYDVLQALSGDVPDGDAADTFTRFSDEIAEAGLVALGRNADKAVIVISEDDLEQAAD